MTQNGKGSRPRPLSIPRKEFGNRWDATFNAKFEYKNVRSNTAKIYNPRTTTYEIDIKKQPNNN